eukprot:g27599.t4
MWYTFFGVSFATGALLGAGLGDYLFHSTMEAAYNYQSMSSYPAVNPAKQKGQEIMDAGRVYFSAGSKLDLSKSMSFHNFEEYCIAPIVNGDEELASYDFWAVGTNCCSEGHFRCGEFANLHARSGLRYMEQEKQVSFQAAVQQAEAAYHLKAKHPLFFVWAQDPLAMINTKVATAQHLYLISVAIVFFTNLFAVIVNPPPVEGAEESLASTARAQSGDGAFVEAPKRNKSVSLPESKPNRPGLGRRTEKDEAQGRTGSIAAGPLPKAAQVQTEAGDGPAGGSKDQGGPRMKGRPSGAFPGLTQHLDPQVDEEEPPAGTPTGVGLAQHNGIRTRALSATKDFQQDEVILASDSTRVIRAADLQGRRFEGCPDDACRLALHVAERAKTGRDSFWTKALAAYPSFSEFEALGMPLAASERALAVLNQVPDFQALATSVRQTRGAMLSALESYNRHSTTQLNFADALWGRLVVDSGLGDVRLELSIQPLTQIPGVSNLLFGPRPFVPLSPSAWDWAAPTALAQPPAPLLALLPLPSLAPARQKRTTRAAGTSAKPQGSKPPISRWKPPIHRMMMKMAKAGSILKLALLGTGHDAFERPYEEQPGQWTLAVSACFGQLSSFEERTSRLLQQKALRPRMDCHGRDDDLQLLLNVTDRASRLVNDLASERISAFEFAGKVWPHWATFQHYLPGGKHILHPDTDKGEHCMSLAVSFSTHGVDFTGGEIKIYECPPSDAAFDWTGLAQRLRDPTAAREKRSGARPPREGQANCAGLSETWRRVRLRGLIGCQGGEEDGQGWPKKSQTVSLGSVKSGVQLEEEEPQVQILSPGWRKLRAKYGGAAAFDQLLQQVRASNTQQLYEDDWLHTGESSPQTGPMARHRAHKAMCPYRTLLGLLLGGIIGAFLLGASPSLANAPDTARLEEGGGAELTGERLVRDVTKAAVTLSPRPALDTLPSSTPSPQPTPSPSGGTSQRPGKTNPIDFPEGRQTRLGDESSQQDRGLSSELSSASYDERLSHDAEVEQLELHGTRLHYRKVKGTGPPEGWVSLRAGGKDLLARERPVVEVVGPAAGYTHRWAVNIDSWEPEGGAEGTEFQFLLQLIKEKNERNKVLRFVYFADQKRALISRLLVRQASRIHVMSDGNMDFTGLCALENCSFILCPPANDRWHPWPFLRRLYDAAVILRTEFVILLEPDNTRLGERSFAGAEYVQRLAQDRRPGFKWTRVNQEAGLCGGSYYRTAAILDAFADESLGPEAYAAERREKRRKTGEEPESSDEDVEEMLGRFETVRQAAGARWSVGHR